MLQGTSEIDLEVQNYKFIGISTVLVLSATDATLSLIIDWKEISVLVPYLRSLQQKNTIYILGTQISHSTNTF